MKKSGMIVALVVITQAPTWGCNEPTRKPSPAPEPVVEEPIAKVDCGQLLDELRALRDGKQPCKSSDDCTVWHNGEHWDGCPLEVTTENASRLDEMRAEIDESGCEVSTGQMCPARAVLGCGKGQCGVSALSTHTLSPEQAKRLEQRLHVMGEKAGVVHGEQAKTQPPASENH